MTIYVSLLKRELWEHRALYIAPLIWVGFLVISVILGKVEIDEFAWHSSLWQELAAQRNPAGVLGPLMAVTPLVVSIPLLFVGFFYLVDSLYGDRKDRSVLFWKSLPVTVMDTVLSKLMTVAVVMPLIGMAIGLATQILFLVWGTVAVWFDGGSAWDVIWGPLPFIDAWVIWVPSMSLKVAPL